MKKNKAKIVQNNSFTEFLIYHSPNGNVQVEIFLHNENIWLTRAKIGELFGVDRSVVSKHLKNIFLTNELIENSVSAKIAHTADDGKSYQTQFYNLDAIISVGYRVNSTQATHFRMWATERLKEYIIKGYVMDDERLKHPYNIFGKDYFEEQLARIRDIRSSERRFYQKITDIYAQCSADYDLNSDITKEFFATVQNKLHWAITHQTAAEIIKNRADFQKTNMGLTNWKNAPSGHIRKTDVSIAKNYLNKEELDSLNRIVSMYLDYAETQANNNNIMYMADWVKRLDAFLQFNEKDILTNAGKVTAEIAKCFAETEYEKYQLIQDKALESDFDRHLIKQLKS
ncbi:MAG: virulence RhuM family protein [bacterium]